MTFKEGYKQKTKCQKTLQRKQMLSDHFTKNKKLVYHIHLSFLFFLLIFVMLSLLLFNLTYI